MSGGAITSGRTSFRDRHPFRQNDSADRHRPDREEDWAGAKLRRRTGESCRRSANLTAGVVTALGREVTSLRVGDRVLAMAEQGGYAEAVTVRADQCYRLPPSMSFTEAASLSLVYDTAWFALRERARLETGEAVLVLGASGGVGQAAIQLAHAMGYLPAFCDRNGRDRCGRPAPTR
jgi:alcohol dehydrogenase-like protein